MWDLLDEGRGQRKRAANLRNQRGDKSDTEQQSRKLMQKAGPG